MKADTQTIDILLLGSGGREHALAAKLAASPRAGKLYIAPGNGGTASCGENVVLDDCDPAAVAAFAQSHGCGLVVIGPEAPLVAGVADAVRAAGIPCFGPGAEGAQMEGSKLFSKQLMERAGIPTAAYGSFTDEASALAYVREQGAPLVVKADGLAAGKGVIVATELEQAEEAVRECFGGTFGDAGNTVVIEEMLVGPECSLLAFTDGKTVRPMATSQDHKRALEGDKGPNTGGMGVYSPVPIVTDEEHATMVAVMEQTVAELAAEGIDAEVINMHTIKPIDADLIVKSATKTGHVVTVEEHSVIGGLGSAVADVLCEQCPTPLKKIGVNDTFGESGPGAELLHKYGLDAANIVATTKEFLA